ncbi:unnamed protein product [Paramecium pentaurelia]|uniref:RING-type domain-containing protein n=1 Tax=Paramecium pentaurelia TaxID=43138 RepID=A0A8S1TG32_9CILI|nr:unnamed protein product [Paramecium pentaurelia]
MNPFFYEDDDDNFNQKFLNILSFDSKDNNQQQKRSHTTIVNSNMDKFKDNQEHQLFKQNMKQSQQIFQRKLEKQKDLRKEQLQDQNIQNQQNQQKLIGFPPISSSKREKPLLIPPPFLTKIYQQSEKPKQISQHIIKIQEIQENFTQTDTIKSKTCSACLQPKQVDHKCDDEYGLIACPYCSDHIVRNFLNDHLVDCIPYIEQQFKALEQVDECIICTQNLTQDLQTLNCAHIFHKSCIDAWKLKKNECPVCRKPI